MSDDDSWASDTLVVRGPTAEVGAPPSGGGLVVLSGDRAGRRFPVRGDLILGRGDDCHLHFLAADISRAHARIREHDGRFFIADLGSQNGTRINGQPIQGEEALTYGDRITLGLQTVILFTTAEDVDDRLSQKDRMEAIARLAGSIAHDFNNLFGAILTNLDFIASLPESTTVGDPSVAEARADIESAVRRAAELTSSLGTFSGTARPREVRVDVSEILREIAGITRRSADGITIETDIEPDLAVHGDPSQIHRAVLNLVVNAQEAMKGGGRVRIAAHLHDEAPTGHGKVRIEVEDTGVGIPPEMRGRLFEPFFTTKPRGNGLGLAAAYGIVRQHSGEILVESEPGRGSRFTIELPAVVHEWVEPTTTADVVARKPLAVLIVDDDPLSLRATKRLLESFGHQVHPFGKGADALDFVSARGPGSLDVAFLDLVMPGLNGVEVAAGIRERSPSTRIIGMSGHGSKEQLDAFRAITDAFIAKPFSPDGVRQAIDTVTGRL